MTDLNVSLNEMSCEDVHGMTSDEMYARAAKGAPRCHMKPMQVESGDIEYGSETWWECTVCGHTKLIERFTHE
jgi:hypothetical protein